MPTFTPILLVTVLLLIVASGIIMLVLIYQKKQIQFLKDKDQMKAAYEKEILESRLEIQEQTMKKISQEIHDNVGQVLSLAKLTLNSVATAEPAIQIKVANSADLLSKAIKDLRELARSLQSDDLGEKGLSQAIEDELEVNKKSRQLLYMPNATGRTVCLPKQKELVIFRMFQEVINNIIKHSKANSVEVSSCYSPAFFRLSVKDNGSGFDFSSLTQTKIAKGIGIKNIQNRATVIGANLTINSGVNTGTLLKFTCH